MSAWWNSLGKKGRDWFIITGFVVLTVVAITVAIVAGVNSAALPVLVPVMNVGIGTALVGVVAGFWAALERLG